MGRHFLVLTYLLLALFTPSALAENLYDPQSGELILPVIDVGGGQYYSGRFSLVSQEPLIWASQSFEAVSGDSRTQATYSAESSSLLVPEINVNGELFTVSFNLTSNCEAEACLEPDQSSVEAKGREGGVIFTTALTSNSTFSCSSCHAMSETGEFAADALRRPGHSMENVTQRPTFKNGQLTELLDAVNICVTEWMNGTALTETDQDWINLNNWLADQATVQVSEAIVSEVVDPPQSLEGGDAENGRSLFNESCIVCHGFDGEGTQLAPQVTELGLSPELIANRVRTSGRSNSAAYVGLTGGVMPFWAADRLSDGELIDIIAFVSQGSNEDLSMGMDNTTNNSSCSADDARVGQTATIAGLFHDVAGTATIIDDCTIQITGFAFDGGGIDTRIYLGLDGEFRDTLGGFSISSNLVGTAYNNNTLTLTLPMGRTLDDFNSISVWCVPVGVSFGTGFFN